MSLVETNKKKTKFKNYEMYVIRFLYTCIYKKNKEINLLFSTKYCFHE